MESSPHKGRIVDISMLIRDRLMFCGGLELLHIQCWIPGWYKLPGCSRPSSALPLLSSKKRGVGQASKRKTLFPIVIWLTHGFP